MTTPAIPSVSLHNGPFHTAQQLNETYLLALDSEKLLAPYYRESGLKEDAKRYGNWENSGLDGHTLGHVLSAAAHSAHATGNAEVTRLVENLVSGLKAAQDHLGTGYVGGIPHGQELWQRIASGSVEPDSFGLNGAWVPWYNLHKLFAGLIDAHRELGNPTALDVVIKLADWWVAIARTMPDDAFEAMLRTEFGAMNAVYADLYELTGTEDYAWLAKRFTDRAFYEPLLAGEHKLPGMHANTQIAKAFGYARVGHATGDHDYLLAAANLWKLVVDNHTYIFGGNSTREHFTDSLHAGFNSEQGPETCNTYNMLRLTNQLLSAEPALLESAGITEHALLDYYERALFNHILPSQHPRTGGLVYFTPVRPNHYRVYSQPQECFWCCVGTGLENHARYTERVFTYTCATQDSPAHLKINLGVAAKYAADGLDVDVLSNVNDSSQLVLRINAAPETSVQISVRLPWWSRRNGQSVWHSETKVWQAGTELRFPLAKRLTAHLIEQDGSENSVRWIAFQRGPQVLVHPTFATDLTGLHADDSRMGHAAQGAMRELSNVPVVVVDGVEDGGIAPTTSDSATLKLQALDQLKAIYADDVEAALEDPVLAQFLSVHLPTDANPVIALPTVLQDGTTQALALQPLEHTHDTRYTMYFPLASPQDESDQPSSDACGDDAVRSVEAAACSVGAVRSVEAAACSVGAVRSVDAVRERLGALDEVTLGDLLFTLDVVAGGEQQPESDHGFAGSNSFARHEGTEHWREALHPVSPSLQPSERLDQAHEPQEQPQPQPQAGYFEYSLKTQGARPRALRLLLGHQAEASAMCVEVANLLDGPAQLVATVQLGARPIESEPAFVQEIPLPDGLEAAEVVRVRFSTARASYTPRVLNVRLVK